MIYQEKREEGYSENVSMRVDVKNRSKTRSITNYRLKKLCGQVMKSVIEEENLENPEISILFVDDEAMKSLNYKYRDVDETTDVLAFPMRDGRFPNVGPNVLGDIVISIPTAERQAAENRNSLDKELALLLIHGFLHLIGYEDFSHSQMKKMRQREEQLLSLVGYL